MKCNHCDREIVKDKNTVYIESIDGNLASVLKHDGFTFYLYDQYYCSMACFLAVLLNKVT